MTYRETDKLKALAIVNIFETGGAFGDFGAVAVLDDGAGISYGVTQFTHKSGSLNAVIERYFQLGGTAERQTIKSREALLKKKDRSAVSTLAGDEEFKKALRAAAVTREMQVAQMQISFERYLKPALDICEAKGFVLPLSLAVAYDSFVHGSWEKISERVRLGEGGTRGRGEKDWVATYVKVRDEWLAKTPRLKTTRYRTRFFLEQIEHKNWNLELPVSVNGTKLTEQIITTKMTTIESFQPTLFENLDEGAEKDFQFSPATTPAENPPETLPGSTETDRPQTRAVRPPSQEAVGSGTGSKQEVTVSSGTGSGQEEDADGCLDKAEEVINAAAAKYDQAERIAKAVITRTDSAKSLWTTVAGTIWQTVWGIAGFLSGMPRTVWLVVAVIVGALMVGYLYRQITLGRIRESSQLFINQK